MTSSYRFGGSKRTLRVYDDDNDDVVILESQPKFFFLWDAYHKYAVASRFAVDRSASATTRVAMTASDRLSDTHIYILKRLWPLYVQLSKSIGESAADIATLTVDLYKVAKDYPASLEGKVFKALADVRSAKTSADLTAAQTILDGLLGQITSAQENSRNQKIGRIKAMTRP